MDNILNFVESSQHCQRNWDLSKNIDLEHLKIFEYILKNVPSKQNIAYYKIHFIFNREIIHKIYENTLTYSARKIDFCNPQTLANLLVVFEDRLDLEDVNENNELLAFKLENRLNPSQKKLLNNMINEDRQQAIGIASGQLVLVANSLGYKTGFCKCFNSEAIKKLLNAENKISLLLGIGFPNEGIPHNIHHLDREDSTRLRPKVDINISTIY